MALHDSTSRLARRLDGLLFFPVTAFDPGGGVDLDAYRQHIKARMGGTTGGGDARPRLAETHAGTDEPRRWNR